MAKLSVTTPFRLLIDNFQAGDYDTGVFQTLSFPTAGVYAVSDEIASHCIHRRMARRLLTSPYRQRPSTLEWR